MVDYVKEWKKKNPYDDSVSWCGPNFEKGHWYSDRFVWPRFFLKEAENRQCWNHDACYAKLLSGLYTGSNDCDSYENFKPLGPATEVGTLLFAAKSMLPESQLKPLQMKRKNTVYEGFVKRKLIRNIVQEPKTPIFASRPFASRWQYLRSHYDTLSKVFKRKNDDGSPQGRKRTRAVAPNIHQERATARANDSRAMSMSRSDYHAFRGRLQRMGGRFARELQHASKIIF
jgi:hypothetical protein